MSAPMYSCSFSRCIASACCLLVLVEEMPSMVGSLGVGIGWNARRKSLTRFGNVESSRRTSAGLFVATTECLPLLCRYPLYLSMLPTPMSALTASLPAAITISTSLSSFLSRELQAAIASDGTFSGLTQRTVFVSRTSFRFTPFNASR